MKKIVLILIFFYISFSSALSQGMSYQDKLYYTCKVWGFIKYFHSEVSMARVNWDSVLIEKLPQIKNSTSDQEFNSILLELFDAAGPMAEGTTDPPEISDPDLTFNLDFAWFEDETLAGGVWSSLMFILAKSRPHYSEWYRSGTEGYLAFPRDNPIIDDNLSINFPDESTRLNILFRYWNIIRYFNPYNNILDTPWDSTLREFVLNFANAGNYPEFVKQIHLISGKLDDSHVEGLTYSSIIQQAYIPKLKIKHTENNYVIVKSAIEDVAVGDIVFAVNGQSMEQFEDSLRPYISAGNNNVFRRYVCSYLIRGEQDEAIEIEYQNYMGENKKLLTTKDTYGNDPWVLDYYICDSLKNVKWKKYPGNIGYVNMGLVETYEAYNLYNELYNCKAIIFDIRNYPKGAAYDLVEYMFPTKKDWAKFTKPDLTYPGLFEWSTQGGGKLSNPVAYKGKVIILCDQHTQSHAEWSCMVLQAMPDVVTIGSPTAGADGNVSRFNISKDIYAGFTSLGTFYPDGTQTQKVGIHIDTLMWPTAKGIREGRDEVLEKAFEVANAVVSVNEISEDGISISPNPAEDYIEINYDMLSIRMQESAIGIYNMLGECVLSTPSSLHDATPQEGNLRIDVSSLPAGVYFVRIGGETRKFIKI